MARRKRSKDRVGLIAEQELVHEVSDVLDLMEMDKTVRPVTNDFHAEIVFERTKVLHFEERGVGL